MTGIAISALTARMVSYSAWPVYRSARVRPCSARAAMPASWARRATRNALRLSRSQPVRVFSVTGTPSGWQAATTASSMRATRSSSRSRAEPDARLHTFLTGQPILTSMMRAPRAALNAAASAIMAGSAPAICTATGAISPSWLRRRAVLTLSHRRGLLAAISDTAWPAPSRLHNWRKGRSVTPAMGATSTLLGRVQGPMRMGRILPAFMWPLFVAGVRGLVAQPLQQVARQWRAQGRGQVESQQAQSAGMLDRRQAGGERARHQVGKAGGNPAVGAARLGKCRQRGGRVGGRAGLPVGQALGQARRVAQPQVQPLAGHRMQGLRGIADGRHAALGERAPGVERQREDVSRRLAGQAAQPGAERLAQRRGKSGVV